MEDHTKLSIQVSLNGLSFCVLDTAANTVLKAEKAVFAKKLTPYSLLKRLNSFFSEHAIQLSQFSEVVAVHRNNLFGLVPAPLFDTGELANYLKFNTKLLANDHMAFDALKGHDMVNVYVPFVNVNNYIYERFGAFTFKHSATVMLESLLNAAPGVFRPDEEVSADNAGNSGKRPVCYVHIFEQQMDIAVIAQKKLLLFNSFDFVTKEDFLYYLLFTMEQLQLDTDSVPVGLFGDVEEGDDLYGLCYRYVLDVAVFAPHFFDRGFGDTSEGLPDFTVLNAL
ncbi:MAG TPA: DUF3822 family protein [Pricia sp.]|nr:DUF3822 family protein [Pricia sp.]